MEHRSLPVFSVQYHPEASPGPHDNDAHFDRFLRLARPPPAFALPAAPPAAPPAGVRMPRRKDLDSVLVLGAGPIVIGQACEFDYSGTQACRALREEGVRVILVNSNPASIMTDPEIADRTYVEPLHPDYVAAILERERPRAILPTVGGQTALNLALALHEARHPGALRRRADRRRHRGHPACREPRAVRRRRCASAGILPARGGRARHARTKPRRFSRTSACRSSCARRSRSAVRAAAPPHSRGAFQLLVEDALRQSPVGEVRVEECLVGWKEFELEVIRDRNDNGIIICSIENLDPMGVHTGDSITVAPAMTLSDREYQAMRDQALRCIRAIGVETGGSNVQFAVHPATGDMRIIEMNPRVSRSSALASKATGFPIARVATKLALGYTLDEIPNDITGASCAAFEPSIDYVVVKMPRWDFEKFRGAVRRARRADAFGGRGDGHRPHASARRCRRAFRSLEIGLQGLDPSRRRHAAAGPAARAALAGSRRSPRAARPVGGRRGARNRHRPVVRARDPGDRLRRARTRGRPATWCGARCADDLDAARPRRAAATCSSAPSATASGTADRRVWPASRRKSRRVARAGSACGRSTRSWIPCAGEFAARTPYYYGTYDQENESMRSTAPRVVVLGGGPNRIGQGIEFDYCCVQAVQAARARGYEAIMINCNPETVSTDYDVASKLYFEPLDLESVLDVLEHERPEGRARAVRRPDAAQAGARPGRRRGIAS